MVSSPAFEAIEWDVLAAILSRDRAGGIAPIHRVWGMPDEPIV
jgi:hypothetical protein